MLLPIILGTVELAAKLAPVVAQAVVSVSQVVHNHVSEAVGLPMKDIMNQRAQMQSATTQGLHTGPSHYVAAKDRYG